MITKITLTFLALILVMVPRGLAVGVHQEGKHAHDHEVASKVDKAKQTEHHGEMTDHEKIGHKHHNEEAAEQEKAEHHQGTEAKDASEHHGDHHDETDVHEQAEPGYHDEGGIEQKKEEPKKHKRKSRLSGGHQHPGRPENMRMNFNQKRSLKPHH